MSQNLDRRELVAGLAGSAPDALFVSGLGSPSWDLAAADDNERHFYLWGGMGQAVMMGLGLAVAQPERRVVVITGDGELLMGIGSLTSVAAAAQINLGILVLDNETYGETGGQPSATRRKADLVAMAKASGIANAATCQNTADTQALLLDPGPIFRLAKVSRKAATLVVPPRDGAMLKDRMPARIETLMIERFRVDGQLAVITGAAAGIGEAAAKWLAEAGAKVICTDRDSDKLEISCAKIPGAIPIALDVADDQAVDHHMEEIARGFGPIGILINNAGINRRRAALECRREDWQAVVDVNMTGAFFCARAAARHMPQTGGAIVNTASIMGLSGGGLYPNVTYATTKGAIVNMTRALAVEWAPRHIRVNAVAPTWTKTEFIRPLLDNPELTAKLEALTPLKKLAEVDDVAAAILFLASPAASMITGHTLAVDGGFLAL